MTNMSRAEVVGNLIQFWSWVQSQSEDGCVRLLSRNCPKAVLSQILTASETFWNALEKVGWVEFGDPQNPEEPSIAVPNFDRWLSNGAKKRLMESRRKRNYRARQDAPDLSRECPADVPKKPGPEKRREEKSNKSSARKRKRISDMSDEEYLAHLQARECFRHLNVRFQFGKMTSWCEVHGAEPTRKRFVNWLNRADAPMNGNGSGEVVIAQPPVKYANEDKIKAYQEKQRGSGTATEH